MEYKAKAPTPPMRRINTRKEVHPSKPEKLEETQPNPKARRMSNNMERYVQRDLSIFPVNSGIH
jgi:hypothetical protein